MTSKDRGANEVPETPTWMLATDDTELTLTVSHDQLVVIAIRNRHTGWNWTPDGSAFPFLNRIERDGRHWQLDWKYQDALVETDDGYQVALRFTTREPALTLTSYWHASSGPGPIEHWMTLHNTSSENLLIHAQESLDLRLSGDTDDTINVWYVNKDAGAPHGEDYQLSGFGVYTDPLQDQYVKEIWTIVDGINDTGFIPWVTLAAEGKGSKHGLYVGWVWEYGRIQVAGYGQKPLHAYIKAGLYPNFTTQVRAGERFEIPAAFIGTFSGDVDDGSNRLRKWLFAHMMPEINRANPSLPTVAWNAFWNTGITPKSWFCEEKKYYPMLDALAAVGIEEVEIDTGWWEAPGDWRGHSERWPSGMLTASQYAHEHGIKFGLYFTFHNGQSTHPDALSSLGPNGHPEWFASGNSLADLGNDACREWLQQRLDELFTAYQVDTYRSDFSPIISQKSSGNTHLGLHDGAYWSQRGFLQLLDTFAAQRPGFTYQNCTGGGGLKGYATMKRSAVIQVTDIYNAIDMRKALYDSLYCFPAMQLLTNMGDHVSGGKLGTSSYRFRSFLYAAPSAHIEHPGEMSQENRAYLAKLITSYKEHIRPLVRHGDVYHILPRPDGVHWDGIEYYDPQTGKGVVMVFKPESQEERQIIFVRGLNPESRYEIVFEDQTNPSCTRSGLELLEDGLEVTLKGTFVAEWIFFSQIQ